MAPPKFRAYGLTGIVGKRELTEFLAELTEFAAELSEFSLPKQYS